MPFVLYTNVGKALISVEGLRQGFSTCGSRRSSRWYASNFHFFTKLWFNSFL